MAFARRVARSKTEQRWLPVLVTQSPPSALAYKGNFAFAAMVAASSQTAKKRTGAGKPAKVVGAGTPAQPVDDPLVIGSFGSAQAETVELPPKLKYITHFEIVLIFSYPLLLV